MKIPYFFSFFLKPSLSYKQNKIWTDNQEGLILQVGFYLYRLTTGSSGHVTASLLGLCLGSALGNAYVLYKQIYKPKTFKMRNLEEIEPPKDLKIQTAFKIVKMKADVKDYANTAAGSA